MRREHAQSTRNNRSYVCFIGLYQDNIVARAETIEDLECTWLGLLQDDLVMFRKSKLTAVTKSKVSH